jgi:[calcium/calmodulin-dependent protein kinase] kinase
MQSILGQDYEAHFVEAPLEMEPEEDFSISENIAMANKSQSLDTYDRVSSERFNVLRGYHQQRDNHADSTSTNPGAMDTGSIHSAKIAGPAESDESQNTATPISAVSRSNSTATKRSVDGTRGHARDPLEEEFPFLYIGPSTYTGSSAVEDSEMSDAEPTFIFDEPESALTSEPLDTHMTDEDDNGPVPVVSESPGAAEFDIYETAYRQQIERIRERTIPRRGTAPKMYLTRRVDGKDDVKRLVQEEDEIDPKSKTTPAIGDKMAVPSSSSSFGSAVGMIRAQLDEQKKNQQEQEEQEQTETQTQSPGTTATSQLEQSTSQQPSTSEDSSKENQSSPPENPRAKLRCLMGRVRGS